MKAGMYITKLAVTRPSLIGDSISFLPVLNYFKLLYPDSWSYWFIAKKCSQSAPLYFNHDKINQIRILENPESFGPKDLELYNSCQIRTDPFPQHKGIVGVNCFWWNERPMAVETWCMAGLEQELYYELPKELQYPKLEVWFDIEKFPKTIAIWNYAAYGKEPKRSPSKEWWEKMYNSIIGETEFKIFRFGHPSEPYIQENDFIKDLRHLSFFEQVKLSIGCNISITTNSGSGWVLGAYGVKQITLLTNDAPNHIQNLEAFAPLNYKRNNINLFSMNGFDTLGSETVLEAIKQLS